MAKTTILATGDMFITRRFPKGGYEGFEELSELIKSYDVGFTNLEMTFHEREGAPAALSGGTWAMADPRTLDDVLSYGFNLFNTANNHSCDYGDGGLLATIRNLKERDMVFAGTGKNLGDASAPCYLETRQARVAMIAVCSSFYDFNMAGGQSGDMQGRPGLNPLRFKTTFHLKPDGMEMVRALAARTRINAEKEKDIREGYVSPFPDGFTPFGAYMFQESGEDWVETSPHEDDMERIVKEIEEAKRQADIVLVSLHAHEMACDDDAIAAGFIETFSRACIDAGADAIMGHGPHVLRGIEIYKKKPIFYSVGNFLFETETVGLQPYDAYKNKKMPTDTKVGAYMDERSQNGTRGLGIVPEVWNAVAAGWTVEDGAVTEVRLYPVSLGMEKKRSQKGVPVLSHSEETLRYLAELSRPYGTEIEIRDGVGYIYPEGRQALLD